MKTFSSWDIIDQLVGITPIYLNAFVQPNRNLYGIRATESEKQGDRKARIFNEADVFGIALAWMLFESGLRTEPIRRIMNELAGTKKANANKTAEVLMRRGTEYIVIVREPRRPRGNADPQPIIGTAKKANLLTSLRTIPLRMCFWLPWGRS